MVRGLLASAVCFAVVSGMVFAVSPSGAQEVTGVAQGPGTVEPTLAECQAFVEENGIPDTRPVAPNRGYSGYDICLNMAYDGDLEGYFASADTNSDGVLQSSEQRAYLDGVIGPVSDPDGSPLTVRKCEALVRENGVPQDRPFVDWGNRGYGEVEICQALAYDGDLAGAFATWDANGDGRLDRTEQDAAVEGFANGSSTGAGSNEPMTSLTVEACDAYIQERGLPDTDPLLGYAGGSGVSYNIAVCQSLGLTGDLAGTFGEWDADTSGVMETPESEAYAESVAGEPVEATAPAEGTTGAAAEQYGSTGLEETTGTTPSSGTAPEETTSAAATPQTDEPQQGVLSAVSRAVSGILPDSGGAAFASIVVAAALVAGGGFLAYRNFRG